MNEGAADAKPTPGSCPLWVGTSGYAYTEWIEAGFYGPRTASADMLSRYAQRFPATELNYTWYQMPRAPGVERQRGKVAPEFRFAAKLTRTLTHDVDPHGWADEAVRYRDGISPLVHSGQLAAVLIQLPPGFDRNRGPPPASGGPARYPGRPSSGRGVPAPLLGRGPRLCRTGAAAG